MSGINGFITCTTASKDQNSRLISMMNSFVKHRGPQGEEIFAGEDMGFGVRKYCAEVASLYTVEEPVCNEDETKIAVCDAEIYNGKELRIDLEGRGHKFKTGTAGEIILHLYEEFGACCPDRINGIFSFAIYDFAVKELFIARDIAGQKPLYYCSDEGKFIFASELKSIIKVFKINKKINAAALNQFLSLTYIPAPLTIFNNIYKLDAGSYIRYRNGKLEIEKYWDKGRSYGDLISDYGKCKKLLREYLFESVEKRMEDGGPAGAFLSGGIDSSTIVGIMSKLSPRPVETYTMCSGVKGFDESHKARIVAGINGAKCHVCRLDCNDVLDELDTILDVFDEPFADSSAIPTYFASKLAGKNVKYVLTGDGPDQMFAGSSRHLINYYTGIYEKIPGVIRRQLLERIIYSLPDKGNFTRKARKVIENCNKSAFEKSRELMFLGFKEDGIRELLKNKYYSKDSNSFIMDIYMKKMIASMNWLKRSTRISKYLLKVICLPRLTG